MGRVGSWEEAKRKRRKKRGESGREAGDRVLEGEEQKQEEGYAKSGGNGENEGNLGYEWVRGRRIEKRPAMEILGKGREV